MFPRVPHPRALALPLVFVTLAGAALAHESEEQKLLASDGAAGDQFGRAVSIDGTVAAVGAPYAGGIGAVYVFDYDGAEFNEVVKLVPSDGAAGDLFGSSVAVSGETILVGAPGHDLAGTDAGAAYVFVDNGVSWVEEQKLLPTVSANNDSFGASVAIDVDTAVVGATRTEGAPGSAYVFVRSAGVWSEEQNLQAPGGTFGNQFGSGVDVQGDTVVVGAMFENGRVPDCGAAFVFDRSAGVWSFDRKLRDGLGNGGDLFGMSVAISDGVIVVGAPGDDDAGNGGGSVFNFVNGQEGWAFSQKFLAKGAGHLLGGSVSRIYNSTFAGSRFDNQAATKCGSAQIYNDEPAGIKYQIYVASNAAASDFLGTSVSAGECYMVVGAPGQDELGQNAGAAYVYLRGHPTATVVNGTGLNPLCMMSVAPPVIGDTWSVTVDTSPWPTGMYTQILAVNRLNNAPPIRPFGEILIDRSSGIFVTSTIMGVGPVTHDFLIPDDPYLTGIGFAAQGIVRDSGFAILGLCNAESLVIGCAVEGGHHTP